jgi:transposase
MRSGDGRRLPPHLKEEIVREHERLCPVTTNHRARKLAVELGWLWLRHQPGSDLSRWFRERVGDLKGRIRRIAIIAMTRKLMVSLWRYLETGVVPTGAVLRVSF